MLIDKQYAHKIALVFSLNDGGNGVGSQSCEAPSGLFRQMSPLDKNGDGKLTREEFVIADPK